MRQKKLLKPSLKSERVVVDEIFDNGSVRLLRARRKKDCNPDDMGIDTWNEESEYFMEDWRIETFVGLKSGRHLREGDVFFIADGSRLHAKYIPIPRDKAGKIHLLKPGDDSRNIARKEIKKQYAKLSAKQASTGKEKETEALIRRVDKKFEEEYF
jgi:hypothetical protein